MITASCQRGETFHCKPASHPELCSLTQVFLGDQSVGKTSIITRFMYDKFDNTYQVCRVEHYAFQLWEIHQAENSPHSAQPEHCIILMYSHLRLPCLYRQPLVSTSCQRQCTWRTALCACNSGESNLPLTCSSSTDQTKETPPTVCGPYIVSHSHAVGEAMLYCPQRVKHTCTGCLLHYDVNRSGSQTFTELSCSNALYLASCNQEPEDR